MKNPLKKQQNNSMRGKIISLNYFFALIRYFIAMKINSAKAITLSIWIMNRKKYLRLIFNSSKIPKERISISMLLLSVKVTGSNSSAIWQNFNPFMIKLSKEVQK